MGLKPRPPAAPAPQPLSTKDPTSPYFGRVHGWQRDLLERLRDLIVEVVPEARSAMKWGVPVFETGRPFCYLGAFSRSVNLGFLDGAALSDPDGLLLGKGEHGRHVRLQSPEDLDPPALVPLIRQAADLAGDPP